MYLNEKEFLFLKELRDRFVGRLLGETKGTGEAKTPIHKKIDLFKSPARDVLSPWVVNPSSDFEPTNASLTFDSLFWRWKRTRVYLKSLFGMDDPDEKKVHGLLMAG